jgi:hypothetical protein
MKPSVALLSAFLLGTVTGFACGPAREVGPTALVLEVYFNESRGTKALLISGTAEVDGVPVNVFPSSQRPEELSSGAAFPVPQTVRVRLNDSRGGIPVQLTVIGLNADGDAVEAATQVATPLARQEVSVTITLRPFTDTVDPDAGMADAGTDAGLRFDAGVACQCSTGCCDSSGRCAMPRPTQLGGGDTVTAFLRGPINQFCTDLCPLGKTSGVVNGQCVCGAMAACGDGLRCDNGRCVCDAKSGCRTCCSTNVTCAIRTGGTCGNAGNQCARCEGLMNSCQATGRCSQAMCPATAADASKCCSGQGLVSTNWPTCTSATGDCVACDPLRSNACRPVAVGGLSSPCGCGANAACGSDQLCVLLNGQAQCRRPTF